MLHIFNKLQKRQLIENMFSYKGIHSYSNTIRKNYLTQKAMEQQAIFAYVTMEHIRSLRQTKNDRISQLFNKQIIFQNVLKRSQVLNKRFAFDYKNMEKVWEGFDQNIGTIVNLEIWRQNRFKDAAISWPGETYQRIVLMPSQITGNIFNQILISYSPKLRPTYKERFIISGEKGTGKSFSYLIYSYLAQFILDYRASNYYLNQQRRKRVFQFIPQVEFNYIKKIIYLPLKQLITLQDVSQHLCLQAYPKIVEEIKGKEEIAKFTSICKKITNFYKQQNGIKTLYVIDEANYYFSCFRRMLESNKKLIKTKSEIVNEQILQNHSVALIYIANSSDLLFNSSQSIEGNYISQWNSSGQNIKYFDIYDHQREKFSDLYIEYCSIISSTKGQLELYEIFYKQLIFQKQKLDIQLTTLSQQTFKKIFYQTFNITNVFTKQEKNAQNNQIIQWGLDVRHLNIRAILQGQTQFDKLKKLFTQQPQNTLEHQENIKKELMRLKIKIQEKRYQQIKVKFNAYCNKSVNDKEYNSRFHLICFINEVAFRIIKQKKQQGDDQLDKILNEILSEQQAKKPSNRIFTEDDGKKYCVQIDFMEMFQKQKNKQDRGIKLIQKNLPSIEKEIASLIQAVGIGYRNPNDPFKCYFLMDPVLLWELTILVDEDFTNFSTIQLEILLQKIGVSKYIGNNMDIIYYKLFKMNIQFILRVDKLDLKNQKIIEQFQYQVGSCIRFPSNRSFPKMQPLLTEAKSKEQPEAKSKEQPEAKSKEQPEAKSKEQPEAKSKEQPEAKSKEQPEAKSKEQPEAKSKEQPEAKSKEPKIPKRDKIILAMNQIIKRKYKEPQKQQVNYSFQLSSVLTQAKKHVDSKKWVVGYPETKNRFQKDIFGAQNPLFDFILVQYSKQKMKQSYIIHTFDLAIGQFYKKAVEIKKLKLVQLAQQLKKQANLINVPNENIEFKHFILNLERNILKYGEDFFEKDDENRQDKMNPMVLKYYREETIPVQNGIKITFGIRSIDYETFGKHIDFSSKYQNIKNILFSLINKVLRQIEAAQEIQQEKQT